MVWMKTLSLSLWFWKPYLPRRQTARHKTQNIFPLRLSIHIAMPSIKLSLSIYVNCFLSDNLCLLISLCLCFSPILFTLSLFLFLLSLCFLTVNVSMFLSLCLFLSFSLSVSFFLSVCFFLSLSLSLFLFTHLSSLCLVMFPTLCLFLHCFYFLSIYSLFLFVCPNKLL